MPEEKKPEEVEDVDRVEQTHTESVGSEAADGSSQDKSRLGGLTNPVVFLLFMIFAMILILAMIGLKNNRPSSSNDSTDSDDPTVALLKADIEARRMELNRQRLALNLPPIEGGSEPVDDIAKRLKRDAETLVGLSESFRQMLAEKDSQLSERNSEILRLEKLRQDVSLENSRLQSELNRALSDGSNIGDLKTALERLQSERDRLALELSEARTRLEEMSGAVDGEEFSDLKRRFDETQRERDFYEGRVKELEAELED